LPSTDGSVKSGARSDAGAAVDASAFGVGTFAAGDSHPNKTVATTAAAMDERRTALILGDERASRYGVN
jgi:hypothetical protein